jgi:4-hydroxybenzoyl-CoA reductase subunit beta
MEYLPEFRLARPTSIEAALAAHGAAPEARYLAGGTDLLANVRRGIVSPEVLVDLSDIAELERLELEETAEGRRLAIGAGVRLADLVRHPEIEAQASVIVEAAREVAAASHREVATVGGNLCLDTRCVFYNQSEWWRSSNDYCLKSRGEICHVAPSGETCFAAFSGDLAPALLALEAEVEIAGAQGRRRQPLEALYHDEGRAHLTLSPEELLVAVHLTLEPRRTAGYAKARVRAAIDFPLAGVAVALARQGQEVTHLRLALTGTNSAPIVLQGTDDLLGAPCDAAWLDRLLDLVPKQIQPMTSTFTPPGYRRKVVAALTRRLVARLYDEAG